MQTLHRKALTWNTNTSLNQNHNINTDREYFTVWYDKGT